MSKKEIRLREMKLQCKDEAAQLKTCAPHSRKERANGVPCRCRQRLALYFQRPPGPASACS